MYIYSVVGTTLYEVLFRIDQELAARTMSHRCPHCGGPLHQAHYPRKPRGGPKLPEQYSVRMSLCCGREGCRKRELPPSCLFLDRKVYWNAIILVVVALRQRRPDSFSAATLRRLFDVSWETVRRWMDWFAEGFARTDLWRSRRGFVPPTVENGDLPAALLEHFDRRGGDSRAAVLGCLEFLVIGRVSAMEDGRIESRKRCPEGKDSDS